LFLCSIFVDVVDDAGSFNLWVLSKSACRTQKDETLRLLRNEKEKGKRATATVEKKS
jgi:hypothetical protein